MGLARRQQRRAKRCSENVLRRCSAGMTGGFEPGPQREHDRWWVEAGNAPRPLAGVAATDREDQLGERRVGPGCLVVVAPVLHAELAPGLDRDSLEGKIPHRLGCEQGGVFAYLFIGGTKRPLVGITEAVAHGEVGVLSPEGAVVSEHDPGARPHSGGGERLDRFSEGIVDAGPGGLERA